MNANLIPDSPTRTAPPDFRGRSFGDLSQAEQIDILRRLHGRSVYWNEVIEEALAESELVSHFVKVALDPVSTPEHITNFLWQLLIEYAERVAAHRGDELTELA